MIALTSTPINLPVIVLTAVDLLKIGMTTEFCKNSLEEMDLVEEDDDTITVRIEDLRNLITIHNSIFVALTKMNTHEDCEDDDESDCDGNCSFDNDQCKACDKQSDDINSDE